MQQKQYIPGIKKIPHPGTSYGQWLWVYSTNCESQRQDHLQNMDRSYPSVHTYDISDDDDTADTPEETRGIGIWIPISASKDKVEEAEDTQPLQATLTVD